MLKLQENDKTTLIQGMDKLGKLYHQEKSYGDVVWTSYFVILKGGYLYFFRNPTDIRPAFSVYIRSATITPATNVNREGAFKVNIIFLNN